MATNRISKAIISKDNRIVMQEKFTEIELVITKLALEQMRYKFGKYTHKIYPIENDRVVEICNKVITKLNKVQE